VFLGKGEAAINDCGSNTTAAFLNNFTGEADDFEARQASVAISFDRDGLRIEAVEYC
jgi:hypothetical protein